VGGIQLKIAVIGAGGFVGARVVSLLAGMAAVDEIRAMDRVAMTDGPKVRLFRGDFSDASFPQGDIAGASFRFCLDHCGLWQAST